MAGEHRDDFERRLLAKVRSSLDYLDEEYPDGWEIEHFVLTFRYYRPNDGPLEPWDGGRYVGMFSSGFTTSSAGSYEVDEWLLRESLAHIQRLRAEYDSDDNDEESDDEHDADEGTEE